MLEIQPDPISTLKYSYESLALEANSTEGTNSSLVRFLPGVIHSLMESVSSTFKSNQPTADMEKLSGKEKDFIGVTQKVNSSALGILRAYVPQGFTGTYLAYLHALVPVTNKQRAIIHDVLQPYVFFLAQSVSDRNVAISTRRDSPLRAHETQREKWQSELSRFFVKNAHHDTLKIKDVVEKQEDWAEIFTLIKQVKADIDAVDVNQITKLLKQADEYLKFLHEGLSNKSHDGVSRETAERVAYETYQVARQLEFFATTAYRVQALATSITDTVGLVNDAMV